MVAMNRTMRTRSLVNPTLACGLMLTLGVCALGCDTVAEISFDIRKYDRVAASGVTNVNACLDDDSRAELRFVLLDQENNVIRPGDQLSTVTVEAASFNSNNVSLEQGRLYSVSPKGLLLCAQQCADGAGCDVGLECFDGFCLKTSEDSPADACLTAGMDQCQPYRSEIDALDGFLGTEKVSLCRSTCAADADCPSGSCVASPEGAMYCALSDIGDFCTTRNQCQSGFECLPIEGDRGGPGGTERKFCTRETTLQVANGSMAFVSPPAQGVNEAPRAIALVMDNSGSLFGRGVVEDDRTVKLNRATDPDLFRIASGKAFLLNLNSKSYRQNTGISVWSFRGESELGVKPLTGRIDVSPVNPYVGNFDVARTSLDRLSSDSDFGRSNVFQAVTVVSQNMIDLCNDNPNCQTLSDLRDTSIVLFTDGPDDSVTITPGADEAERQLGRERWQANLDEAVAVAQAAGTKVFIIHLDRGVGPDGLETMAADPANAVPALRDAQGRTGPLAEFSQLACATGGQYVYVTDPFGLNFYFDLLTDLVGGTWKVDMAIEALDSVTNNGAYRFGANVSVNLDNRTESFFMSPFGIQTSLGKIETDDSRPVVFKRKGLDAARGGQPGGGDGDDGGGDSGR